MNPNELAELRKLARARHRAATRKVSRLRTTHDVELSGTKYDPRRDLGKIKRYTAAQLRTYIGQLNEFTARKTQYVGDAQRRPIKGTMWEQYKALEAKYNERVNTDFANMYADVFLPMSGQTLGERMAATVPTHRQMGSPAVNSPYNPPARKPRNVGSEKALKRLMQNLRDRVKPEYRKRLVDEGRQQYGQMLDVIDQEDLRQAVNSLNDEQFFMLWNYTPFAGAISLNYEIAMKALSSKEQPFHSKQFEDQIGDARALVNWAKSVRLGG